MKNPVYRIGDHKVPVNCPVPLCAIVGPSGVGKTTLIEALLPRLAAAGLRVAVIKHAHAATEFDRPGKDSHRAAEAGAAQVIVASRAGYSVIERTPGAAEPPSLEFLVSRLDLSRVDFVLAEGFHFERVPKIEVVRGLESMCGGDPELIAIASDAPTPGRPAAQRLDLNDPSAIAAFITERLSVGASERPAGRSGLRASGRQEIA